MAEARQVILKAKRQASPKDSPRWEEFALPSRPSVNVIICLRDTAEHPATREGKPTTPISYDSNCLEEVCGSGAMHAKERIHAVMGRGGIEDCANAQNCVEICPKGIPLTESLAEINREAWKQALLGWLIG